MKDLARPSPTSRTTSAPTSEPHVIRRDRAYTQRRSRHRRRTARVAVLARRRRRRLEIAPGEICGIIGYSGAGKTTLAAPRQRARAPHFGYGRVDGTRHHRACAERELRALRGGIGMIFQQFNLFDRAPSPGTSPTRWSRGGRRAARSRTASRSCSTSSGSRTRRGATPSSSPAGRSSGSASRERWRPRPRILLADEATSALDPDTTQEVLDAAPARQRGVRRHDPRDHARDGRHPHARRPRRRDGGWANHRERRRVRRALRTRRTRRRSGSSRAIIEDVPVGEQLQTLRDAASPAGSSRSRSATATSRRPTSSRPFPRTACGSS